MTILRMSDVDLCNKKVLIRVDLNVPIQDGNIVSTQRIHAILPTLRMAQAQGARILLMSHLGRPKEGEFDPNLSLKPVADYLSQLLKQPVRFLSNWIDQNIEVAQQEIVLLENVRFLTGEKNNSTNLAKQMANLCDVFVMDAFATAHRKEASTYGVAEFAPIASAGPLLLREIDALKKIMQQAEHPLLAIVGGSKVSTKLTVLESLLNKVDTLIVGGGIANTFLAASGYHIGKSLHEASLIKVAEHLINIAATKEIKILLPIDVVVAKEFNNTAKAQIKDITQLAADDMILDVGPQSSELFAKHIKAAKTILWNGPVGVFEWDAFAEGTRQLAKAVTESNGYSVAGGGDTLAAIDKYHVAEAISYISTGGGAFLEFIEGKDLPAITILERSTVR